MHLNHMIIKKNEFPLQQLDLVSYPGTFAVRILHVLLTSTTLVYQWHYLTLSNIIVWLLSLHIYLENFSIILNTDLPNRLYIACFSTRNCAGLGSTDVGHHG